MQKKLDLMKTPASESFLLISKAFTEHRIYLNKRPGRSLNFGFSKGGTLSREALIKYIKKTPKYFQLVSLIKQ